MSQCHKCFEEAFIKHTTLTPLQELIQLIHRGQQKVLNPQQWARYQEVISVVNPVMMKLKEEYWSREQEKETNRALELARSWRKELDEI